LEEWMWSHRQETVADSTERDNNLLLPFLRSSLEPAAGNDALDCPVIYDTGKARSNELVALAFKMWQTLSPGNLPKISQLFREAINLDPNNAEAFAGLAHALIAESLWGIVRAPAAYTSAQAALKRALEIDPELQDAQCVEAWLKLLVSRDWQDARQGFEKAMKHPHTTIRGKVGLAAFHIASGCFAEASRILLEVAQQNPLSPSAMGWNIWVTYLVGEYASSLFQIEQFRISGFQGPVVDAIEALVTIQFEEPEAQIERIEELAADSPQNEVLRGALGHVYGVTGQSGKANEILDAITRPEMHARTHEPYAIALVLIGLNRNQEAVKWLEQSYREGSRWSLGFPFDPILASLRIDPLYGQLMSKVSYPALEDNDALLA
jgi:tetratricopeptide (TPR) repeat protein